MLATRLLAAMLCLVVLSSCSPLSMAPEDLLAPPRLNQRQTKVEAALDTSLGLGAITYKYPQNGGYRSPFVFHDIDRDGREEAIVFYTHNADTENIRAKILREESSGEWSMIHDLSGPGDQVDFIEFAPMLDPERDCVLVGWKSGRSNTTLGVYSFYDGGFHREAELAYQSLEVSDYLGNDLTEIALVYQDFSGNYQLILLGRRADGTLSTIGQASLGMEVVDVLGVQNSLLWTGAHGVIIDEVRADNTIATEIFEVDASGLLPLVTEEAFTLYEQTFRFDELLSVDLYGQGTVSIPTVSDLPGKIPDNELPPPSLITYIRPTREERFVVTSQAVVNDSAGYLFFFPPRWLETVTVLRRPESSEWQFYKIDPQTELPSVELLRIRVHSVRDYWDRNLDNYDLLAEKGLFQYYAYLPPLLGESLALSQAEIERLFHLL